MYERMTNSGHTVKWNPDDEELAEQAMEDQKGNGVPTDVNIPDDANVPVEADIAAQIRERYREKHIEKYGEDSRYYDGSD